MRFAICNEIYKDWPFDRTCDHAKQAGYDALELAPFTFAPLVTEISPASTALTSSLRRKWPTPT